MSLLQNISDQVSYQFYKLTYNPEAEQYAASVKAAQEANDSAIKAQQSETDKKKAAEDAKAKQLENAKRAAEEVAKNEFNLGRFIGKVMGIVAIVLLYFLVFAGAIYGAHLATNLNVYRTWPYRLLYAIYGFLFFPIVILYVIGYRYWWQGMKPRFYGLLPLIPYFINSPLLAFFFSWLSYRPDEHVDTLHEWNICMKRKGMELQAYEEEKELEASVGL
jgi:hypothetical protein